MEPISFSLKNEQGSDLSCVPPHVLGSDPRNTHRKLPKRSISSSNFNNSFPHNNPGQNMFMEPNYISLGDQQPQGWGHQEWVEQPYSAPQYQHEQFFPMVQRFGNNQYQPTDSFESKYFEANQDWERELCSSEMEMGGKSEHSSYELLPEVTSVSNQATSNPSTSKNDHRAPQTLTKRAPMEKFPDEEVADFKHVIYNLLVEYHNNHTSDTHLVEPCTVIENDRARNGFRFNENCNPEKRLPELYVQHLKNAQLELENQNSPLIQDLYKFYMRSCVELLSKYFEKVDKYTYLYEDEDNPLFIPNGNLVEAEARIKNMKTRTRKKKAKKTTGKAQHFVNLAHPQQVPINIPNMHNLNFLPHNGNNPIINLRSVHPRKKAAYMNFS